MVTELTAGQTERLAQLYREWLAAGKSCEPLIRDRVTDILVKLYRRISKPAPRVLFFSSPAMCLLAWARLTERQLPDRIRSWLSEPFAKLWDRLPEQLDAQLSESDQQNLRSSLSAGLASALRNRKRWLVAELEEHVRNQMGSDLWAGFDRCLVDTQTPSDRPRRPTPVFAPQHWGEGWASADRAKYHLQFHLQDQVKGQSQFLRSALENCLAQDPWSLWEMLYAFCVEIGINYSPDQAASLGLYFRCSRELHWWFPFDGVVLASERHSLPLVDEHGRLHAADGPAVQYADGWGVAMWNGIMIPDRYAQPTAVDILTEPNAELRRVLMERYDHAHGKGAFIQACGAKVLDSAVQPMPGDGPEMINELLSIDLPDDDERHMVCLKIIDPSTGRIYIIRVPPDMRTVRSALAWSFDVPPKDYVLEQET
jgi:hypothetical protein